MSVWNRVQYQERSKIFVGVRDTGILILVVGIATLMITSTVKLVVG